MELIKYDEQTKIALFSYHSDSEIAQLPTMTRRAEGKLSSIGFVGEGSKALSDTEYKMYSLTADDEWVEYELNSGGGGSSEAVDINYDNTQSGLSATNVQNAIDEISEDIPTKTSDLVNDSGFITSEDLPTVPTKTSDLTNDSGFITSADIPEIPTKLSDLESDATHRTVTDIEKASWNAKSDFSGDYEDLANKPNLAEVATSGSYNDLFDKPTIPSIPVKSVSVDGNAIIPDARGNVDVIVHSPWKTVYDGTLEETVRMLDFTACADGTPFGDIHEIFVSLTNNTNIQSVAPLILDSQDVANVFHVLYGTNDARNKTFYNIWGKMSYEEGIVCFFGSDNNPSRNGFNNSPRAQFSYGPHTTPIKKLSIGGFMWDDTSGEILQGTRIIFKIR